MQRHEIHSFFEILASANPAPIGELEYTNPFTLLVAVVLSAQSTDKSVNKATQALFKFTDTPQKMLDLGEQELKNYIKSIGFYNTKARNIIELSRQLIDKFNGEVPRTLEELISLPGVGRKTANVILNIVFHQPTLAVDTHVFRVSHRTGLAEGRTPHDVEKQLLKVIPDEYRLYAHHWLILHGRYICKARRPLCEICPVSHLCDYYQKTKLSIAKSDANAL